MVNVFGDCAAADESVTDVQVVKKVVVTKGQFKDYKCEIKQSYVLGFTTYRLHTNVDGEFVTPIRAYDGWIYVLDDVATMEIGGRYLQTDTISSKLVYFVKGTNCDGGNVVALHGDKGQPGPRGSKGDPGDRGSVGSRGVAGTRGASGDQGDSGPTGAKGMKGDTGDRCVVGPVGSTGVAGPVGSQGVKGSVGSKGDTGAVGPRGVQGEKGEMGSRGLVGSTGSRGVQG